MHDAWQAPHHLLVVELLQGLEVEMPKALVPPLGVIVTVSYKTKGLRHLHMEDIEAVAPSAHLGEELETTIPDVQHPMLDLHTRAVLNQLSQADDGVPQRGDVVDAGEQPMFTGLGDEDNGANTLDLHGKGVLELDG
jgi:hypothetical protein